MHPLHHRDIEQRTEDRGQNSTPCVLSSVLCPLSSDKGRRWGSHPHRPHYECGAFLARATPAAISRSARIRTLCGWFGSSLLSQEHAPETRRSREPSGTTQASPKRQPGPPRLGGPTGSVSGGN